MRVLIALAQAACQYPSRFAAACIDGPTAISRAGRPTRSGDPVALDGNLTPTAFRSCEIDAQLTGVCEGDRDTTGPERLPLPSAVRPAELLRSPPGARGFRPGSSVLFDSRWTNGEAQHPPLDYNLA